MKKLLILTVLLAAPVMAQDASHCGPDALSPPAPYWYCNQFPFPNYQPPYEPLPPDYNAPPPTFDIQPPIIIDRPPPNFVSEPSMLWLLSLGLTALLWWRKV